jgi:hypothetical protein
MASSKPEDECEQLARVARRFLRDVEELYEFSMTHEDHLDIPSEDYSTEDTPFCELWSNETYERDIEVMEIVDFVCSIGDLDRRLEDGYTLLERWKTELLLVSDGVIELGPDGGRAIV